MAKASINTTTNALKVRNDLIYKMSMEGFTNEELATIFNLEAGDVNRIVNTLWTIKGVK